MLKLRSFFAYGIDSCAGFSKFFCGLRQRIVNFYQIWAFLTSSVFLLFNEANLIGYYHLSVTNVYYWIDLQTHVRVK